MRYKVFELEEAQEAGCKDKELLEYIDSKWYYTRYGVFLCEDGKPVKLIGTDGGEPEDQDLCRDFSWVVEALNNAYLEGERANIDRSGRANW